MAVMNRSMFQRPMPVVRRNTGTPPTGEITVEDYIAKGFDPYEFEADQAMDAQNNQPSFFGKIFDNISDFFRFGRSDPESRLIIAGEYFDPEDPNFKMFIENNYMSEGDTYIEGIEKFKAFAESQKRSEGSPIQGENSYYSQTINPEIIKEQDIALDKQTRSHEQFLKENDSAVNRIITTNIMNVAKGNVNKPTIIMDAVADSFNRFGKDATLKMLIEGNFHKINPKVFQYISTLEEYFPGTYFEDDSGDYEGRAEDYYYTEIPKNMKRYIDPLMEIMSTDIVSRQQGSPMQGEQVDVENVGIMDGFSGDGSEAEAMAIVEEGERAKNEIDGTSTYDELMQSIRGDNLTEADRRQELASYVGEKDAEETPDSVLTLVQPVMQMLDEGTANTGIGQIEEGREMATIAPTQQDAEEMMAMNMPQQPVGVANGGYMSSFPNQNLNTESLSASDNIDDRIMKNLQFEKMAPGMMGYANGGQVQHFSSGNLAEIQNTYNERLPLYMDIINNPERSKGNTLMDMSQAFLSYGMGADPKEALSYFIDKTGKRVDQQAKTEQAIKMGALNAAIAKFDAKELATIKALTEQSKKNKTMVVGLTKERDRIIAKLLGLYKDVPTYGYQDPDLAGDEFSAGQVKDGETQIIDYEKLYELYPSGTELQFNNNFTEFLGKKGSGVRYEGVKKAEGGIVYRNEGTPEDGEIGTRTSDLGFGIIDVPMIVGTGERDDIIKVLLGTDAALQELLKMKQLIADDPSLAGFPGAVLEKTRGLFTIFDQIDNAYLNDKFISSDSGIYKFFDKPAITEINKMKKRISKALADLASFKGTRQPTVGQLEETQTETDPAGGFGSLVSLEKIDAVGDEMVMLVKQLLRGLGGPTQGTTATQSKVDFDMDYIQGQYNALDEYLDQLKTISASQGTEGFADKESYTIEELEQIVKDNKLGG